MNSTHTREPRGNALVGLVITALIIGVLALVASSAFRSMAEPAGGTGSDPLANPGANPTGVVGAAQAMVLDSHVTTAVSELSAGAAMGGDPSAAARSFVARYPTTTNGVTITANVTGAGTSTKIQFSDGATTKCVVVAGSGFAPGAC